MSEFREMQSTTPESWTIIVSFHASRAPAYAGGGRAAPASASTARRRPVGRRRKWTTEAAPTRSPHA
eukprot:4851695-Pleurochrysis_carterae.AAC.3